MKILKKLKSWNTPLKIKAWQICFMVGITNEKQKQYNKIYKR